MRLQTKSNAPLEVEQEVTIELPFKRAQVVMAMVVIGLLVAVFVLSPPITELEAEQPLVPEATNAQPDNLAEYRSRLGDSDFSPLGGHKLAEVVDKTRPPTTPLAEANKALIQRAYDEVLNNPNLVATDVCPLPMIYGRCAILNEAELAVVDELFAPCFQHDQPGLPVFSFDSQAVRLRLSVYRLAVPDLHYSVEALVARGDLVLTRWQARGTHSGKFGLHDPTSEPMAWRGMTIWRIAEGQIVEAWTIQQGPTFN